MFVVTANVLDTIQPAFLDRMEVIRLSGYTDEEKLAIAKQHLIPKQMEENGIKETPVVWTDSGITRIITATRRKPGFAIWSVRSAPSAARSRCRWRAETRRRATASPTRRSKIPRPMKHFAEELLERDQVGVATGLAWTAVGGDILFIEALAVKGKGKLVLTGQLGDVMKESAQAALTYARAHADEQNIPADYFETHDIHIHVPAGAIPKDGPSAGITMTSAITR